MSLVPAASVTLGQQRYATHAAGLSVSLATLPGVETHQRDASKIVIVMEAANSGIIGGRLAEIATWQGVLSANMVFEQVDGPVEIGD